MDTLKLGQLIEGEQHRDATHIAVAPVVAFRSMAPGEHVGLNEKGEADNTERETIGIIDPFLKSRVMGGERCWLFLYPGTIKGLRHEWTHPAFEAVKPAAPAPSAKEASEQWLRNFCNQNDCPSYEQVVAAALRGDSWSPEHLHFDGYDAHGEIPNAFWDHLEVVTGQKFTTRATYFSCSC